jgi:hypothetical protein
MLIEPCTPPHNPNYEYDLVQDGPGSPRPWKFNCSLNRVSAQIPYRDDPLEWDDWPPTYAPMYAMFHGWPHDGNALPRDAQ